MGTLSLVSSTCRVRLSCSLVVDFKINTSIKFYFGSLLIQFQVFSLVSQHCRVRREQRAVLPSARSPSVSLERVPQRPGILGAGLPVPLEQRERCGVRDSTNTCSAGRPRNPQLYSG